MKTKELPFIHLMKTPFKQYAYDVNTNVFIEVGNQTYRYLELQKEGSTIDNASNVDVKKNLDKLCRQGFFSPKRPLKIEHDQTHILEYHLNENIKQLILQLTQQCNFRCAYCTYGVKDFQYQREHSSKSMTQEMATRAIDFFHAHSSNQSEVSIGFYGGEPLLEFELLKKLVNYAEKKIVGKTLLFSITTNGSLLTPEVAKFMSEHKFTLMISLDGTPEIHDHSRKFLSTGEGTFATIKRNIDTIKREFPEWFKSIIFHIVIDPRYPCNNLHALFSEDDTFKHSIILTTLVDDVSSVEKSVPGNDFIREHNQHLFKAYLAIIGRYPKDKVSRVAKQMLGSVYHRIKTSMATSKELSDTMAPSGPCIPGERRLFINVDGDFYPCERVSETSDAMIIGNLQGGFDLEKANRILNVGQLTGENCRNCWTIRQCQICVRDCDNNGELSGEVKLSQCDRIRARVEGEMRDYLFMKEFSLSIDTILREE